MKKSLTKKLVLKKHTVASLNADQLGALQGGVSALCTKQQKCYYSEGVTLCGSCEGCTNPTLPTEYTCAGQASCYWQCTG